MPDNANCSIAAVIVTYNPELNELKRLIGSIKLQVAHVAVIDNGSREDLSLFLPGDNKQIIFNRLQQNYGIAKAQNIGIGLAKELGAEYVLLLDQDSIPADDMVSTLLAAAQNQIKSGVKLACVGPRYLDGRQNNPPPFVRINGFRLERQTCEQPDSVVDVDYLIASGSLVPIATLDAVGGMQENLFIDYVDIEWGLRAQYNGYRSFGVCAARMQHDLGENPVRFLGRNIPVHSPLRHYYHFRNAIWLYRQPWLRFNWKTVDAMRLARKFIFYSLMTRPQLQHAKMMLLGIAHGLTGKMGKKKTNE